MFPRPATLFIMSFVCLPAMAENGTSLNDETDRINYAIGHQIGIDFRKQQVDLDRQAVTQGLQHGHQGSRPALEVKDMNRRLVELKRNITEDTKAKAMERVQKRQTEMKHKRQRGEEFLAANAGKPGIISTDSGLQYRIITPGEGSHPKHNDRVKINYESRRISGQVIHSSKLKGGPRVFPVNSLIPGVTEALKKMQPGAKWELYIPHELAFGRQGPFAHEAIISEVELLEVLPKMNAETVRFEEEDHAENPDRDGNASSH